MKKSLTRVLSLVLVLVMMLGVMPVASAANTDAAVTVTATPASGSEVTYGTVLNLRVPTGPEGSSGYSSHSGWSWTVNGTSIGTTEDNTTTYEVPDGAPTTLTIAARGVYTMANGDTITATGSTSVTVTPPPPTVSISGDTSVSVGDTIALTAGISSGVLDADKVTWEVTSGTDKIESAVADGAAFTATAKAAGDVVVSLSYDGEVVDTETVTISEALIKATASAVSVKVGETTPAAPVVTYTPALASGVTPTYAYASNNEAIATVADDGKITGVAAGSTTVTITITGVEGLEDNTIDCAVTVTNGGTITCANQSDVSDSSNSITLEPTYSDASGLDTDDVTFTFTKVASGCRGDVAVSSGGVVTSDGPGVIMVEIKAFHNGVEMAKTNTTVSFYAYNSSVEVTMNEEDTQMLLGTSSDIKESGNLLDYMLYGYDVTGVKNTSDRIYFGNLSLTEGKFSGTNYVSTGKYTTVGGAGLVEFVVGSTGKATFTYKIVPSNNSDGVLCEGHVTIDYDGQLADIEYSTTYNKKVTFVESDFYKFWDSADKDSALDYVIFSISSTYPGYGTLYTSATSTTTANKATSSHKFYYGTYTSGTNNKDLGSLTYVPLISKTSTYDVSIPFTAYGTDTDDRISGTVVIHLNEATNNITPRGIFFGTEYDTVNDLTYADQMAATFNSKTGKVLDSVIFTLPAAEKATLYSKVPTGASGNTLVAQGTQLKAGDRLTVKAGTTLGIANSQIKNVALIPAAGFSGPLTISFTGYASGDTTGTACTITFDVKTKSASAVFSDVNAKNYSWASDSVDFLYYEGTAQGSNGKYNPSANITRRDFMLMLYRAFLAEDYGTFTVTSNFPDVVKGADSYSKEIYQAVGVAKYLGIAQGTNNKFNPTSNITRQEAMVLIYRTLETINKDLEYTTSVKLSSMKDASKISSWATAAISNLVGHGVIKGNNDNIKPLDPISRAEMAAILHRVITY